MNAGTRLAGFALVLAAAFAGGWAMGAAVGPDASTSSTGHEVPHVPDSSGEVSPGVPSTTPHSRGSH